MQEYSGKGNENTCFSRVIVGSETILKV